MSREVGKVESRKGNRYTVKWDSDSGKVLVGHTHLILPDDFTDIGIRVKSAGDALNAAKSYVDGL